jgi:hypothetical protein
MAGKRGNPNFIKKEKVVIKIPLIIMSLILFISQLLSLIKALD